MLSHSTGRSENSADNEPPPEIQAHESSNDVMSEVTEQLRADLIATTVPEAPAGIGQPITPLIRSFKNMNISMVEDGCNSNGTIGPF